MNAHKEPFDRQFVKLAVTLLVLISILTLMVVVAAGSLFFAPEIYAWYSKPEKDKPAAVTKVAVIERMWRAPDESSIPDGTDGEQIRYGRELIAHTAEYLGPKGKVKQMSNGMNCQNCHLDAGTKPYGNNYSAVASTYPKYRPRSGTEETIEKRVNDCFVRSLNGMPLNENSKEMKAIVAYIKWLGKDVPIGVSPEGAGIVELEFLDRPANPERGKILFTQKCVECHGAGDGGAMNAEGTAWIYPPLWGEKSYNSGAGLLRLSRFAGYIRANMPLGASNDRPQLTDEEAWDIAAYVNSLPRPQMDLTGDWPDFSKKPFDHPFGPFADGFSEQDHKYGPYKPIIEKQKELSKGIAKVKG